MSAIAVYGYGTTNRVATYGYNILEAAVELILSATLMTLIDYQKTAKVLMELGCD